SSRRPARKVVIGEWEIAGTEVPPTTGLDPVIGGTIGLRRTGNDPQLDCPFGRDSYSSSSSWTIAMTTFAILLASFFVRSLGKPTMRIARSGLIGMGNVTEPVWLGAALMKETSALCFSSRSFSLLRLAVRAFKPGLNESGFVR